MLSATLHALMSALLVVVLGRWCAGSVVCCESCCVQCWRALLSASLHALMSASLYALLSALLVAVLCCVLRAMLVCLADCLTAHLMSALLVSVHAG